MSAYYTWKGGCYTPENACVSENAAPCAPTQWWFWIGAAVLAVGSLMKR